MKFLVHLVLWAGWLMLAYLFVASLFLLKSETETSQPDTVLRVAFVVTAVVALLFGIAAYHIRKHLFWIRRKITIDDGAGRAIFLGFSMAAMTGGGLSAIALFAPRVLWGTSVSPVVGTLVAALFLVLMFPSLPRESR